MIVCSSPLAASLVGSSLFLVHSDEYDIYLAAILSTLIVGSSHESLQSFALIAELLTAECFSECLRNPSWLPEPTFDNRWACVSQPSPVWCCYTRHFCINILPFPPRSLGISFALYSKLFKHGFFCASTGGRNLP